MPTVSHDEILKEVLKDPAAAAAFLNDAIQHGTSEEVASAFESLMKVHGDSFESNAKTVLPNLFGALARYHLSLQVQPTR